MDDKNRKFFDSDFPVFYKNEKGMSAIDTALEKNQIRSVNLMIDYIVEYQNSYFYGHLFNYNVIELINKGVKMTPLFKSKVFNHTFDFDEWPSTNSNTIKAMAPFNESMFKLRHYYQDVFPKIYKRDEKMANKKKKQSNYFHESQNAEKVYKI